MMEYTFRINNLITEKEKSNQFNLRLPFSSVSFNFAILLNFQDIQLL